MALYEINPNAMRGSGTFTKGRAGEALGRCKLVYKGPDGRWFLADADLAAEMPVLGLTMERVIINQVLRIMTEGYIGRVDWTWTTGTEVYASSVAGELVQVPAGLVQIVGMATRTNMIYFCPKNIGAGGVVCALLEGASAYVGFDVCKGTNYANYWYCNGVADNVEVQAAIDFTGNNGRVIFEVGTYQIGANTITIDYDDIHLDFEKGAILNYTGAGVALLMGGTVTDNRRITVSYPTVWAVGAGSTAIQMSCKESVLLNPRIIGNATGICLLLKAFTAGHDAVYENTVYTPIIQSGKYGIKLEKNGTKQINANQFFGGKIICGNIVASIAIWLNGDNGMATNTFEGLSISNAATGIEVEINNPLNWFKSIRDEGTPISVNCIGNRNVFRDCSFLGAVTVSGDYNVLRHNVIVGAITISDDTDVPEFFIPVSDPNAVLGRHPVVDMPDDTDTHVYAQIQVPNEYQFLITARVIVVSAATGNMVWTVNTDFGLLCGSEDYDAHSDVGGATTGLTVDDLECLDISAALTLIAAGDLVGVDFMRNGDDGSDTIDDSVYYLGIRFRYV